MTQEALKLALEYLESRGRAWNVQIALREALREHAMREVQRLGQEIEQEPVVGITAIRTWFKDGRVVTQTLCNSWVDTTPPQRSESSGKPSAWVGLTDEEYTHITDTVFHTGQGLVAYYKAIEARLKEKNNA